MPPLVSIIINNYNYGRFLREALNSALDQSYSNTEVIAVDDGSTDDSRQIIADYGEKIIAVLKENGGQASALNAGFLRSHGDLVIFLDSDDMLAHETAQHVTAVFTADPQIARIQYRLAVIDTGGARTGALVPAAYLHMPGGDLRCHAADLNNYAAWWPPTSGHAFTRSTLNRILPMPEDPFRLCADYYLLRASALCAPIVSLDEVCGYYRFHGSNHFHDLAINLDQTRQRIILTRDADRYLKQFADSIGTCDYAREADCVNDVVFLAQRMVSLKLDAARHPIPEDGLWSVFRLGAVASLNRSNASLPLKLLYLFWFAAIATAPLSVARSLAEKFFHPESRERLNILMGLLRPRDALPVSSRRLGTKLSAAQ